MVKNNEEFDLVVVGGGCAGYPASMYAKRFNLKVLVITSLRGGLITTTHLVENWPGVNSFSGGDLAKSLEDQAIFNGVEIVDDTVLEIKKNEDGTFEVKTEFNELTLNSKTILLATGSSHRHLGLDQEKKLSGKGVSYCATCDGGFFKNKEVVIVGGSDSAVQEAMVLASVCSKVTMLVRSELKGEPINNERVKKLENVEVKLGVEIKDILGEDRVEGIILKNGEELKCSGVFIAVGLLPQNKLAKDLQVELNKKGEIITDKNQITNVKGVYAAGDVTDTHFKQGIVAASEGATASNSVFEYIGKNF